ncbi:amino acid adenylation domain-containing protein [Catenulispora sp. EB89]|uniref:amino acid adenylation domain-containing protein n=1 Tax=Catenulispora sp. EB89 TaxID=3156257 RepID=UPI0035198BD8
MTESFSAVVIGEEPLLVECTRVLLARGHRVLAVVSPEPDLLAWAEGAGLPAVPLAGDLARRLAPLRFDYLFSIANLRMLSAEVLALPTRLPVNFHDGPLPRHAGLFATSWAILDGDEQYGVTWHVIETEADTGDILKQRSVAVDPAGTAHDLNLACFDAALDSFSELVDELAAGTATRTPQDLTLRTYHGRFDGAPRGGLVDWRRPAAELDALVRATTLGHGGNAFGTALLATGPELLAVRGVELTGQPSVAAPGTVVAAGRDVLTVATVDNDIRFTDLATLTGERVDPLALADARFRQFSDAEAAELTEAGRAGLRQERYWRRVLDALSPLSPPRFGALAAVACEPRPVALPPALRTGDAVPEIMALAGVFALLARLARDGERDVALALVPGNALLAADLPLRGPEDALDRTLAELAELVGAEVAAIRNRSPYRRDLPLREPCVTGVARAGLPVAIVLPGGSTGTHALTIGIDTDGAVGFHDCTEQQALWLADRLALFYEQAVAGPDRPVGALGLLHPAEQELLRQWNDTAEDYPRASTVSRLVTDLACAAPDTIAVRSGERTLSYAELDQAADRLAGRLVELGAGPGTFVGVYLARSPELLVSLLAVVKSGAAYLPIDPIYPVGRIRHMLTDSGTRLVLTDASLRDALSDVDVTPVAVSATESAAPPVDRSDPDGDAYLIYTSGSTGLPKGVRVGHRALVNFLCAMARHPGFDSADSLLALTTVCFDIAGLELYLPVIRGGTVEILPEDVAADGFALRQRVEQAQPTVLQATPTSWQMLLAAGWTGAPALRALCGGEALPAELADRLVQQVGALYNMYGPTETTIWSTVDRVRPGEPVTIGRPIANTRCQVLDERGRPVPPGIPGELYLSGDGVANGYLDRPELTAQRFVAMAEEPVAYRTGDLVRYLPDGRLEYLERLDGQIKLNGYRIELGEVESALRRLPGVAAAVALVRLDRLIGYVTGDAGLIAAELRAALRDSLPAYMVPAAVLVLPSLPQTPNGKIDRSALPAPELAGATGTAPRTELERQVAEIWCEVLGLARVGTEDNFFDVGGDSLRLTSVTALLRERLNRPITRLSMFRHPTVRAMAADLAEPGAQPVSRQRRARDTTALAQRRDRKKRQS